MTGELVLVSNQIGRKVNLLEAIADDPQLELTIDGASTLSLTIADHDRELITWAGIDTRCWIDHGGRTFELVAVSKSGDTVGLTFEDSLVAALRRHTAPKSFHAGHFTRAQIATWFAQEARVPIVVDPTHQAKVANPIARSADGQKSNSWDVLGSDVAEPINWRRFSTGRQLVLGGDEWLVSGYKKPVALRENTGGVGTIDFDLDVAKRASSARVSIDVKQVGLTPGTPVTLPDLGPASGAWIVEGISGRVYSTRADLTLTRKTHVLKEPKRQTTGGGGGGRDKDSGDPDRIPGQEGNDTGGTAANPARARMVAFALAQRGKPYVWGASGPGSYDCSGLVQAATRAAGKTLGKPAASQWATCRAAGKAIPVAQGLKIRGALLFRIGGTYNHVAISLGNGTTMEAMGTGYGCLVAGNAASRGWTGAALWL